MSNQIILQGTTDEKMLDLFDERMERKFQSLISTLSCQSANEDLLTREQTCQFLQIDSSTLWHWTNKGKVSAYGIGSRRYYKRSELLDSLIKLKK